MNKPLQIPATLEGINALKAGDMSIRFHSQEMSAEEALILLQYRGEFGWLMFKPEEFKNEEIPTDDPEHEGKTPQQRLRARMFVYFVDTRDKEGFNKWYAAEIEKIGQKYLEKLST